MSMTPFPHGITSRGVPILGSVDGSIIVGNVFFVCSVASPDSGESWSAGVDSTSNGDKLQPFATIDYAIGKCKANNGDVIFALPGHIENVGSAGALDLDVAGVTVVFLGNGNKKATINFRTVVGADMDIDAANINLVNPRFTASIDALTGPIDVNSADFKMFNAKWYDGTAIDTTDCIVADANATRITIDGWKYFVGDGLGTQKQSNIQIAAAINPILRNIDIVGDFATGNIENGTAWANAILEDITINNKNAIPTVGILLQATSTGTATNTNVRVASGTTYVTANNDMQWFESFGTGTDATAGEKIGTILSGDIEGKLDVVDGYFDVPTADATTDTTIRDVVGRKTDAAVTVVAATKSLMAYLKGVINWLTVGVADATSNASAADVVGNKTDAQVVAVGTTKSVIAYLKGLIVNTIVSAADTTNNIAVNDAVGNKTDAAVTVVGTTKSVMAYLKGAVNWLTVGVADAITNASAADVVGNKTDASVYVPGTTKSLAAYAKGTAGLQERVVVSTTAALVNGTTIFTIAGGPIKVESLFSLCMATGDGGAATLQYSADPTVGVAGTISGATGSLATAVAGSTVTLAGTALATAALFSVTGPNLIANPGTIIIPEGIITTVVAGAASTATWAFYLRYKPLAVGVTVV